MWQPIETAPKDGTWVLLCKKKEKWHDDPASYSDPQITVAHFIELCGTWRWIEEGAEAWGVDDPTHWMPLPVPPAT